MYSPDIERLVVIPNFTPMMNSSETLTSPRMAELMQALEAEAPRRILIFDMPPVLAADDVLAFAPQIDGLLLVVAEGTTGSRLTAPREGSARGNESAGRRAEPLCRAQRRRVLLVLVRQALGRQVAA